MKDLMEFAKNVQLMRKLQKEYFKTRDQSILQQSKNTEKMIDNDLKEILEPEDKSQTKLFG